MMNPNYPMKNASLRPLVTRFLPPAPWQKLLCLLVVSLHALCHATGTFSSTGSLPSTMWYLSTSLLPSGNALAYCAALGSPSLQWYDTFQGPWTSASVPSLPEQAATVTLQTGDVLIAGGQNNDNLNNLNRGGWSETTSSASATGIMVIPRFRHTLTLLQDGTVLAVGGEDGSYRVVAQTEIYNPATGSWSATLHTLGTARKGHSAVLMPDGKVLVVGGVDYSGNILSSCEMYDPSAQTWTTLTS